MKKIISLVAGLAMAATAWSGNLGIANHLGVGVSVSTAGIGIEAATPITSWVQARAGVHIMPGFHFDTDVNVNIQDAQGNRYQGSNKMDVTGSLKRVQGSIIFNVYPIPKLNLYVAAGGYFAGRDLIKITGHYDDYKNIKQYVSIGDYNVPLDENGDVRGGIQVMGFRPYLGLGWGKPVPGGRLNFGVELGVQFNGSRQVYYWEDKKKVDAEKITGLDNDDTFQKVMNALKVYPMLKLTLSGRIF